MSASSKTANYSTRETEWNIQSILRYEAERPQVVSTSSDWEGDVSRKTIDTILQVLQGKYPPGVYLAEKPHPGSWTRKLKLFLADHPGQVVTIIGGGAPRLWLGDEVAYQLPNADAKLTAVMYHTFPQGGSLSREEIPIEEVQGGLSAEAGQHIHSRIEQVSTLIKNRAAVPSVWMRGSFTVPRWKGGFLVYSEPMNYHPGYFLLSGKHGLQTFLKGVENLFQTLRQINVRSGGQFNGDLVHRLHGGSANLDFTPTGEIVIRGWGKRKDDRIEDWPPEAFRSHQMREVAGALAGLMGEILNSNLATDARRELIANTVKTGLEAYTGRYKTIDPVALGVGLPSKTGQLIQSGWIPPMVDETENRDYFSEAVLYQECGRLPDGIKQWLIKVITTYL